MNRCVVPFAKRLSISGRKVSGLLLGAKQRLLITSIQHLLSQSTEYLIYYYQWDEKFVMVNLSALFKKTGKTQTPICTQMATKPTCLVTTYYSN